MSALKSRSRLQGKRSRNGPESQEAQMDRARKLWRANRRVEALAEFQRVARQGNPSYQMELGITLFWDTHAYRSGLYWIRKAAEGDHLGAQYFLGAEFATGEHLKKNPKKSVYWYQRAARGGHAEAQYNLALMYWEGEGLKRSVRQAHKWLESSARSNDLLALRALSEAYETGWLGYRIDRGKAAHWRRRYQEINRKTRAR
jgi:uncharacterized protein